LCIALFFGPEKKTALDSLLKGSEKSKKTKKSKRSNGLLPQQVLASIHNLVILTDQ
jgi:hypothetical protein